MFWNMLEMRENVLQKTVALFLRLMQDTPMESGNGAAET